jgi:hypothetical protein
METLADAVIAALAHISTTPEALGDRLDQDVRILEMLTVMLREAAPEEREALRDALARARSFAARSGNRDPDLLETYRAIEADLLEAGSE